MARTILDIDTPILKELKDLQKKEGRSLGKITSQLIMEALTMREKPAKVTDLRWISHPMHPIVDLSDKDMLYTELDRDER